MKRIFLILTFLLTSTLFCQEFETINYNGLYMTIPVEYRKLSVQEILLNYKNYGSIPDLVYVKNDSNVSIKFTSIDFEDSNFIEFKNQLNTQYSKFNIIENNIKKINNKDFVVFKFKTINSQSNTIIVNNLTTSLNGKMLIITCTNVENAENNELMSRIITDIKMR